MTDSALADIPGIAAFERAYREVTPTGWRKKRDCCLSFLRELCPGAGHFSPIVGADPDVLIAAAYVRATLASDTRRLSDMPAFEPFVDAALAEAEASGNRAIVFHTLYVCGMALDRLGFAKGVTWIQRSLFYAPDGGPAVRDVLSLVGTIWAFDAARWQQAIVMFEWAALARPAPMWEMVAKHDCQLRFGDPAVVKERAARYTKISCVEIGDAVAARIALNRKRSAAKLAAQGLAVAVEQSNLPWKAAFARVIKTHGPASDDASRGPATGE